MSQTFSQTLRHLTRKEHKALDEFVAQLLARYPDELALVRLFGSKARGNFDAESDVDVLVIVEDEATTHHRVLATPEILSLRVTTDYYVKFWNPIVELSGDLQLKHNVNISPDIMLQSEYNFYKAQNMLFYRNVRRYGVNLWTKPKNSPSSAFGLKQPVKTLTPPSAK